MTLHVKLNLVILGQQPFEEEVAVPVSIMTRQTQRKRKYLGYAFVLLHSE